jgi:urease accessory protein UreH
VDSARAALRSLAGDDRAVGDVGRRARLELTFGYRGDRTVLLHSYAEPPFRVGRVLSEGKGIHLILASSAPGVFGGDSFTQTVVVESGAQVRLTSQSAMQIHANEAGALATLASTYRVESGGHLECEWDPAIPFADSKFDQKIVIDLAHEATLLWSDALMAGREARGERWRFSCFAHELRLVRAGTLTYMERYRMRPGTDPPRRRWIADEACYVGTVLAAGGAVDRSLVREVHEKLQARSGVRASADLVEEQLLLLRLVGSEGTAFHQARALSTAAVSTRSVRLQPDHGKSA